MRYHTIYWDLTRSTEISPDLLRSHKIYGDLKRSTDLAFDMGWHLVLIYHDIWHLTYDIWHMTFDIWHLTYDIWHMTFDMAEGTDSTDTYYFWHWHKFIKFSLMDSEFILAIWKYQSVSQSVTIWILEMLAHLKIRLQGT